MAYLDQLHTLADDTENKLLRVVEELDAGTIDLDDAVALIAAILAAANARATVLADLSVAAAITVGTQSSVGAVGVTAPAEVSRLNKAARTLLEALPDTPDPQARIRRLGRLEPLQRAADARGEALARQPMVEGWTRSLNGDTCQLCTWWWRDGRVWPKDHPMPRHKGCDCTQQIVIRPSVRAVQR